MLGLKQEKKHTVGLCFAFAFIKLNPSIGIFLHTFSFSLVGSHWDTSDHLQVFPLTPTFNFLCIHRT